MRVPAGSWRNFGASFSRLTGRRKSASAVACERSASYMSPCTNFALSATPASSAFLRASATMSASYSTPRARAPRFAAAITRRPSPEPRSTTKSRGVTAARSSIFSTSARGVGTQTTSLPAWPSYGSKGCVCAAAAMGRIKASKEAHHMPITELNHFLLVAKNLERTRKFYEKVLGFEVAERPDFGFPGYWLAANGEICVHLASQDPNRIRDQFLLKKHPKGTKGSGSVDHIAFLARNPGEVRSRIQKNKVEMHFRSFPDAKLFQIFLKDPDDVTIELNFLGEVVDPKQWKGKGSASAFTLERKAKKN